MPTQAQCMPFAESDRMPFFFYGTLQPGQEFYDRISRFGQVFAREAIVRGACLRWNPYHKTDETLQLTAALAPGLSTDIVRGSLLIPFDGSGLAIRLTCDEMEFAFHRQPEAKKYNDGHDNGYVPHSRYHRDKRVYVRDQVYVEMPHMGERMAHAYRFIGGMLEHHDLVPRNSAGEFEMTTEAIQAAMAAGVHTKILQMYRSVVSA